MSNRVRLSLGMASLLLFSLAPTLGARQMDNNKSDSSMQSATGCLQKGDEAGGYTLTDTDGKVWELRGSSPKLAKHVGQTVTVKGMSMEGSKSQEAKIADDETKEANGKQHADLKVSSVKMVSSSCK